MSQLGEIIDHTAALQREVNRLNDEVLCLALLSLSLAVVCGLLGWRLLQWDQ